MTQTPLEVVHSRLERLKRLQTNIQYAIPALWIPPHVHAGIRVLSNPAAYYHEIIGQILKSPIHTPLHAFGAKDVAYLLFIRYTTAWDHDGSKSISYTLNRDGWRQTGTFLKTIALLPYLRWLGITTLIILPITQHGRARKKGTLGSPYAPSIHNAIEETLTEPILQLDSEIEFAALIEACHRLGMRVIIELALRVAALDCPLIESNPSWFYWVRADAPDPLLPPSFPPEELAAIERRITTGNFQSLPEPSMDYRSLFVSPPVQVLRQDDGTYLGIGQDGTLCRVPSVFADYPPNDTQPLWTDVTYLRLHSHPTFNYIAYNTVRYYDSQLAGHEQLSLWHYVLSVISSFLDKFDIDGILLDMGHALPKELHRRIIQLARSRKPNIILIEESFDCFDPLGYELGYNAVVGDVWHWSYSIERLRSFACSVRGESPLPYLATPDTHNTPRIAQRGIETALYAYALCSQLPHGIPTITTGSELGEHIPINTGLDFQPEELSAYSPEHLPLFSGCTLSWQNPDWRVLRFLRALYSGSNLS
ncbi:MAG: hypothetical protein RMK00_02180 [Bacteroidota bacterium]|nr:hypothetical protein [Candidatus Kapabacteria bacterium]MDW8074567.1 hypothetical protein [Bacteroidota bacterium]